MTSVHQHFQNGQSSYVSGLPQVPSLSGVFRNLSSDEVIRETNATVAESPLKRVKMGGLHAPVVSTTLIANTFDGEPYHKQWQNGDSMWAFNIILKEQGGDRAPRPFVMNRQTPHVVMNSCQVVQYWRRGWDTAMDVVNTLKETVIDTTRSNIWTNKRIDTSRQLSQRILNGASDNPLDFETIDLALTYKGTSDPRSREEYHEYVQYMSREGDQFKKRVDALREAKREGVSKKTLYENGMQLESITIDNVLDNIAGTYLERADAYQTDRSTESAKALMSLGSITDDRLVFLIPSLLRRYWDFMGVNTESEMLMPVVGYEHEVNLRNNVFNNNRPLPLGIHSSGHTKVRNIFSEKLQDGHRIVALADYYCDPQTPHTIAGIAPHYVFGNDAYEAVSSYVPTVTRSSASYSDKTSFVDVERSYQPHSLPSWNIGTVSRAVPILTPPSTYSVAQGFTDNLLKSYKAIRDCPEITVNLRQI